jgi:hypothetical protein
MWIYFWVPVHVCFVVVGARWGGGVVFVREGQRPRSLRFSKEEWDS